jgi:vesicle-associated membrane protein 7
MEKPSIIYALVANHASSPPLVDVSLAEGNYHLFAQKVLAKVNVDFAMTLTYASNYAFHYQDSQGYTFLCMTDIDFSEIAAHCFLKEIENLYSDMYGSAHGAIALSGCEGFERILREKMQYYNQNDQFPTSSEEILRGRLEDVMDKADLTIDMTVKKSPELLDLYEENEKNKLERLRRHQQLQVCLGVMSAGLALIFVVVTVACGGFDYNVCS